MTTLEWAFRASRTCHTLLYWISDVSRGLDRRYQGHCFHSTRETRANQYYSVSMAIQKRRFKASTPVNTWLADLCAQVCKTGQNIH